MPVLYPRGFVLYQILCKAWTIVAAQLFGFTLAVHLLSSIAAAAGYYREALRADPPPALRQVLELRLRTP
jgi:hypothetical protein